MKLTIVLSDSGDIFSLEVAPDTSVSLLKDLISIESSIEQNQQLLLINGQPIPPTAETVSDLGMVTDDSQENLIYLARRSAAPSEPSRAAQSAPQRQQNSLMQAFDFSGIIVQDGKAKAAIPAAKAAQRSRAGNVNDRLTQLGAPTENAIMEQVRALVIAASADEGVFGVLKVQNPVLGEAIGDVIKSKDKLDTSSAEFKKLTTIVKEQIEQRQKEEADNAKQMMDVMKNPLSSAAQEYMLQQIQNKQVEENFLLAREHLPEAFATVFMLYVDIEVNGVPIKAFVDSGAQSTFMSQQCAERCSLMRLVDKRFRGTARGVGRADIIGKIHMAPIKMGNKFFPSSFMILEDDKVEFLLGLDLLRRFQCCIDLEKNVLRIDGEELAFLDESKITPGMFGREDSHALNDKL